MMGFGKKGLLLSIIKNQFFRQNKYSARFQNPDKFVESAHHVTPGQ